jgi:predicted ferric reductase
VRIAYQTVLWVAAYFLLAAAPLLVLFIGTVPPGRGFWREVSVGLGFVGLSMMGFQFLLTGRFKAVTAPYGIDVVYHFHRQVSLVAFLFVIAHPVIIFAATPVMLPLLNPLTAPWRALAGMGSVVALAVIIGTSLYRRQLGLPYEVWRLIHGVAAIAAVALALIHMEGVGYYVQGPLKRIFWVLLASGWIIALLLIRFGKPLLILKNPYRVTEVRKERGNTWTLVFEPEGRGAAVVFEPGQFAWLKLGKSPFAIREHPFSFSGSAMDQERLEITIKELGDFTSRIGQVKPGTRAYIDAPYGSFTIDRHQAPGYVFIAGGVGITPVRSILKTMADRHDTRPCVLFYGNKDWSEVTFREELEDLKGRLNLKIVHVLGKPPEGWEGESGRIDAEMLARYLPHERLNLEYFVCGPEGLQMGVKKALMRLGISPDHIQSESFNYI